MLFERQGKTYLEPQLVLFTDLTTSGCRVAQSASGPFYCPEDRTIYIDLGFFAEMQDILEEGDIEEGINAAGAVGDDRIQRMTQGYVVPDAFTHGTSEQRIRWFIKGLRSGDISQGDTFTTNAL